MKLTGVLQWNVHVPLRQMICVADTSLPQLMHERVSRLVDGICDETTWHLWYLHIQTTEDNNTSTINIKACYSIKEK